MLYNDSLVTNFYEFNQITEESKKEDNMTTVHSVVYSDSVTTNREFYQVTEESREKGEVYYA